MKLSIISRFLYVLLIVCLQLHTMIQGHGFCEHTIIKRYDTARGGSIVSICRRTAKGEKVCIPSYDTDTHTHALHKKVKRGGQSSVPRHVHLSCTSHYSNMGEPAIACSPLQEFYCVDTHRWMPAYQLKAGDRLLSYCGPRTITYLKHVDEELKVYALEIEPPHTFFVGQEELLTHNMALPGSWAAITPLVTFGSGATLSVGGGAAAGALLAPFLVPVVLVAGLALSGALSALVKAVCSDAVPTYHAVVDGICSFFETNQDDQDMQGIGESNQPSSSPNGGPKKDKDDDKNKNKIKFSEKDKDHIFRKSEGHFPEDRPEIRRLLEDMVSDKNNFNGYDKYGTAWYSKIIQNGKQVWAGVRDNAIRYAGINDIPWLKDSITGLLIRS